MNVFIVEDMFWVPDIVITDGLQWIIFVIQPFWRYKNQLKKLSNQTQKNTIIKQRNRLLNVSKKLLFINWLLF